jgi:hypothetical protein
MAWEKFVTDVELATGTGYHPYHVPGSDTVGLLVLLTLSLPALGFLGWYYYEKYH